MWRVRSTLVLLSVALVTACDDSGGENGEPDEDQVYYCAQWAGAWCPAYEECDPFDFGLAFGSTGECAELSQRDCLDPPSGTPQCAHPTRDETDGCVAYLQANHPDGCENLFGPLADMSACEEICD